MKETHLFLYEYVKKNSRIILYGLGGVGRSYLWQIEETAWCEIIGVCDKNKKHPKYRNFIIEELGGKIQYDYVVIAIENKIVATEAYEELVSCGVEKAKVVNLNMRSNNFPIQIQGQEKEKGLYILILDGGGLGDALIDVLLIKKMREMLGEKGKIFFACNYRPFFSEIDFITGVYEFQEVAKSSEYLNDNHPWDLILVMHNFPLVTKMDYKKITEYSPSLAKYCCEYEELFRKEFSGIANNYRFTKYALLRGKNRIEQLDVFGTLGIDRKDRYAIPGNKDEKSILQRRNLDGVKYITVGRDVGSGSPTHPKLWPVAYYCFMLREIKKLVPDITIVHVGKKGSRGIAELADLDLTGQTKLHELKTILGRAVLHIDGEGGLVHLRHFLGGVSAVFFGPTSPENFGYDENINIYADACREHCEWLTDRWAEGCLLGHETPICMEKNDAEPATKRIVEYLLERI